MCFQDSSWEGSLAQWLPCYLKKIALVYGCCRGHKTDYFSLMSNMQQFQNNVCEFALHLFKCSLCVQTILHREEKLFLAKYSGRWNTCIINEICGPYLEEYINWTTRTMLFRQVQWPATSEPPPPPRFTCITNRQGVWSRPSSSVNFGDTESSR